LRRAVELNPRNVSARQWLSYYLVFVEGRFEEGIAQARRAVELDPLAPLLVMQLGMTLMGAGRYEEAAAPLQRAADFAPAMFLPTIHLGLLYNHLGRSDEAVAPLEGAVTTSGRHPWTLEHSSSWTGGATSTTASWCTPSAIPSSRGFRPIRGWSTSIVASGSRSSTTRSYGASSTSP
jgi:tetratricopeptide (TPR) repeat protein